MQSADHDVVVIAVADLVLTVQRDAETGTVNVTQVNRQTVEGMY